MLDWLPVPGATKYEVQVGLDEDFTIPMETKTVYSTRYSPVTTYDNDFVFWRVRAIDTAGTKMAWPNVAFSFERNWLDRPTLQYPANDLSPAAGDALHYQWTPVQHATRYQLQVGSNQNFCPNTYDTCLTAGTTYTPGEGSNLSCMPGQGEVAYWRVRALDTPHSPSIEGIYSEIHSFVYDSDGVSPTSPGSGATVGVPTLTWSAARDAEKYYVEVRDNTGTKLESATTNSLSWTPKGDSGLDPIDGPFTWSVQSVDLGGSMSPLDFSRSFVLNDTIPTTGADPLTPLTGRSTDAPTLRSPKLTWEPMNGAQYYRLQIGVSGSGFWLNTSTAEILRSDYHYPSATDTGTYFLNPGAYDWRVLAYNDGGRTGRSRDHRHVHRCRLGPGDWTAARSRWPGPRRRHDL